MIVSRGFRNPPCEIVGILARVMQSDKINSTRWRANLRSVNPSVINNSRGTDLGALEAPETTARLTANAPPSVKWF